ncbi:unnamed protein product [Symbiodinium necroappetens]|uniref:UspA domain-containing protein n=1 Tax=Symbiodinium necroappetens TaxID=1628268 RepID=A0A812X374_9DINO|nr:unnamed protein product [Symbiodinium necroappetens]
MLEAFRQEIPSLPRQRPPFAWQAARDFQREFDISGEENEIVTKVGDFKESHWAVPIAGTLKLFKGCIYRWTLRLEHICRFHPTRNADRSRELGDGGLTGFCAQAADDNYSIDQLLHQHIRVLVSVDGSDQSSCAFEWVLHGFTQSDRETDLLIVHYYDDTKEYLPPKWRRNAIQADAEAKCTSYLVSKRYAISVRQRSPGVKIGDIKDQGTSFCVMGFAGRKGKDRHIIGSNVLEVMQRGKCSCVDARQLDVSVSPIRNNNLMQRVLTIKVFKEADASKLPLKRPAKFVVSTGLNPAATKAFIDALRLSRPGDHIHVVYIRPYLEPHSKESRVTQAIRHKYDSIFEGMQDAAAWPSGKMVKFKDACRLPFREVFAPQGINEGIAQANNFEADFVMVGTNVLRVEKGKPPLGSVSLQIVMEFPGNCVVSSFNPDTEPELTQPSRPSDASRAVEWNLRRGQKGLSIGAKSEHQSDGGDRMLKEGDFVHVEVDLRGLHLPFGTLAIAINSEPAEMVFDDIALSSSMHMMPVVCMGSDGSRVRVCPAF